MVGGKRRSRVILQVRMKGIHRHNPADHHRQLNVHPTLALVQVHGTTAPFQIAENVYMTTYGYLRTSREEPGHAGSDPETQRQQLLSAGVNPRHIYSDVGTSGTTGVSSRNQWHALDQRLSKGDVLVVAAIDSISRRYLDTMWAVSTISSAAASGYAL